MACKCSEKKVSLAAYPWDQCMRDQIAKYGSEETARKVCASIKNRNNMRLAILTLLTALVAHRKRAM